MSTNVYDPRVEAQVKRYERRVLGFWGVWLAGCLFILWGGNQSGLTGAILLAWTFLVAAPGFTWGWVNKPGLSDQETDNRALLATAVAAVGIAGLTAHNLRHEGYTPDRQDLSDHDEKPSS